MGENKRSVGTAYEQIASEYLEAQGFVILEKNYRNRYGEIDIVAQEGKTICFVEVKYRSSNRYGYPIEAVDYRKQKKILAVSRYYLLMHGQSEWTPCRFDIVAIEGKEITLLRNAFGA